MSVLRVLDRSGDTATEWKIGNKKSVKEVQRIFDELVGRIGYMAFRVDSPTSGEVIRTFDPEAREIIVTTPMVGG